MVYGEERAITLEHTFEIVYFRCGTENHTHIICEAITMLVCTTGTLGQLENGVNSGSYKLYTAKGYIPSR